MEIWGGVFGSNRGQHSVYPRTSEVYCTGQISQVWLVVNGLGGVVVSTGVVG